MAGHSALSPEHHVDATRQAIHQVIGYLTACMLKNPASNLREEGTAGLEWCGEAASAPNPALTPGSAESSTGGQLFTGFSAGFFPKNCTLWPLGSGCDTWLSAFAGTLMPAIFSLTQPIS